MELGDGFYSGYSLIGYPHEISKSNDTVVVLSPKATTVKVTGYMFKASSFMVTDLQAAEASGGLGHPGYVTFEAAPRVGEET